MSILEQGQQEGEGIGFLREGSMVVVSEASEWVGEEAEVRITGSASTARGRIFFASLAET